MNQIAFLAELEQIVQQRRSAAPESSYTAALLQSGTRRVAQKVGEEAVELALAATSGDRGEQVGEAADLLFHLLVLLVDRELPLADVVRELETRHRS